MGIQVTIRRPNELSDSDWNEVCSKLGVFARQITPVVTGELRAGWDETKKPYSIKFENDVKHAVFVDKGTRYMASQDLTGQIADEAQDLIADFLS